MTFDVLGGIFGVAKGRIYAAFYDGSRLALYSAGMEAVLARPIGYGIGSEIGLFFDKIGRGICLIIRLFQWG